MLDAGFLQPAGFDEVVELLERFLGDPFVVLAEPELTGPAGPASFIDSDFTSKVEHSVWVETQPAELVALGVGSTSTVSAAFSRRCCPNASVGVTAAELKFCRMSPGQRVTYTVPEPMYSLVLHPGSQAPLVATSFRPKRRRGTCAVEGAAVGGAAPRAQDCDPALAQPVVYPAPPAGPKVVDGKLVLQSITDLPDQFPSVHFTLPAASARDISGSNLVVRSVHLVCFGAPL